MLLHYYTIHNARLHPKPVSSIQAVEITDKTITLDWNIPEGDFEKFEVTYQDASDRLIQNFTEVNSITIGGLRPYKNYTFTVVTIAGSDQTIPKRSTPISSFFTTKEGVPGSLSSFEPIDVKPNLITFQVKYFGISLKYFSKLIFTFYSVVPARPAGQRHHHGLHHPVGAQARGRQALHP